MDHQKAFEKIEEWRKKHGIKTWKEAKFFLKTYGMIQRKYKGDVNAQFVLTAYPSEVKNIKPYLTSTYTERYRQICWYRLNEEGKKVVSEIASDLKLNKKEIETLIFTM
jgi:hypothetical protein